MITVVLFGHFSDSHNLVITLYRQDDTYSLLQPYYIIEPIVWSVKKQQQYTNEEISVFIYPENN